MLGSTRARFLFCGTAFAAIIAMCGFAGPASARAAAFAVNSTADAPLGAAVTCAGGGAPCTLRAAVQAADAAGGTSTITLPPGEYALMIAPPTGAAGSAADDPASGDLDVDNHASVTVAGSGTGMTLIDAGAVDRAFAVHAGASLRISDLTVQGGSPAPQSIESQVGATQGGAIYTDGTLSTVDVSFTANSAGDGGAIYADADSRLSVNGGSFTGNGNVYGGAIEDASANPAEVENATFARQTANDNGGDIYYTGDGALTVAESSFADTVGYGGGGAIYAAGSGALTITGSQFTADSSSYGGAIYSSVPIDLYQDTFADDTATAGGYGGGALYLEGSASTTQTLMQDQFSGDSASSYGGAIETNGGLLEVAQSSITGSEAQYGGAVYLDSTSARFEDDTIAQSSAVYGGAFYLGAGTPAPLALVNDTIAANSASVPGTGGGIYGTSLATSGTGDGVVNTIIADNIGGDCDAGFSSAVVTGYDLDSDSSCFGGLSAAGLQAGVQPSLAAPADNGGPVLTMLEQPGSPTIGTGDSAYCPSTDARGVVRDPSSCDLGAYQAVSTGLTAGNAAPASADVGSLFAITLTGTNAGPGVATKLTITDQLPDGTTLAGEQPSAGSCAVTGTPATISCAFGNVAARSSASVVLFVSSSKAGTFTNTATVSDDQGSTQAATAQTAIISTAAQPAVAQVAQPTVSPAAKPAVSRAEVKQITSTAATLRARLDPYGNGVSYWFQYGPTRRFGKLTRVRVTELQGVRSARVVGLWSRHRYYFRLVATSGSQVTYGRTYSFVTKAPPRHRRTTRPKKQK